MSRPDSRQQKIEQLLIGSSIIRKLSEQLDQVESDIYFLQKFTHSELAVGFALDCSTHWFKLANTHIHTRTHTHTRRR